jgi:hypothetical protein
MRAIPSPSTNVWYNKKHKVGIEMFAEWLKNMLKLVGKDDDVSARRVVESH